ncbi:MAG: DJ-1/PfpI family protein [Oligoflexia bacterium]|nr:DJ-1/PfpI family protein [Oligoflexia bacterium]MBF0367117.1 DJ-1/PfpI family protein [Oligoflexia bacterium]
MQVCMLFCDGFEDIEALAVVDILRRANVNIDLIGVENETVESSSRVIIKMERTLREVTKKNRIYDMVILPGGGLGTANLERSADVRDFILKHVEFKKKIAAICAAPRVLAGLGLLKGKKATCYPSVKEALHDSTYVDAPVVVDGNFITSRGPATACAFGFKILEEIGMLEASRECQEKMLFG